jgi:hypothetical protein
MLEYQVSARRIASHGGVVSTKDAETALDTDINGRSDAFDPAELFLAAIAARSRERPRTFALASLVVQSTLVP